jgi:hypothetical protein
MTRACETVIDIFFIADIFVNLRTGYIEGAPPPAEARLTDHATATPVSRTSAYPREIVLARSV